jgi:hypothetical protein
LSQLLRGIEQSPHTTQHSTAQHSTAQHSTIITAKKQLHTHTTMQQFRHIPHSHSHFLRTRDTKNKKTEIYSPLSIAIPIPYHSIPSIHPMFKKRKGKTRHTKEKNKKKIRTRSKEQDSSPAQSR